MKDLGLLRKEEQDYDDWIKNQYRTLDLQLQTLKGDNKIEYRKGKNGGWFLR